MNKYSIYYSREEKNKAIDESFKILSALNSNIVDVKLHEDVSFEEMVDIDKTENTVRSKGEDRSTIDDFKTLIEDKRYDPLKYTPPPVVVTRTEDGKKEVIAGIHRSKAFRELNMTGISYCIEPIIDASCDKRTKKMIYDQVRIWENQRPSPFVRNKANDQDVINYIQNCISEGTFPSDVDSQNDLLKRINGGKRLRSGLKHKIDQVINLNDPKKKKFHVNTPSKKKQNDMKEDIERVLKSPNNDNKNFGVKTISFKEPRYEDNDGRYSFGLKDGYINEFVNSAKKFIKDNTGKLFHYDLYIVGTTIQCDYNKVSKVRRFKENYHYYNGDDVGFSLKVNKKLLEGSMTKKLIEFYDLLSKGHTLNTHFIWMPQLYGENEKTFYMNFSSKVRENNEIYKERLKKQERLNKLNRTCSSETCAIEEFFNIKI